MKAKISKGGSKSAAKPDSLAKGNKTKGGELDEKSLKSVSGGHIAVEPGGARAVDHHHGRK
jgi:hypothetical protein